MKVNSSYTKLLDFLEKHAGKKPVSFHMPGHKGSGIFRRYGYDAFLENFMDMDVTEIPGADNLFAADGVIAELQERYAQLYGVRKSWLMVNGTSGALIASILATVPRGGKIIMARNCHKSVFNGVRLAGAIPIYARPRLIEEYGIAGEVAPAEIQELINTNPDAAAILITSPNYYGVCSDIKSIADMAHDAGMILIVDQAHGAHLKFFGEYGEAEENNQSGIKLPGSAEELGADIVANSTHKTLASMTQSAILNLCSDRVSPVDIEEQLQVMESSSPSYVLMSSLDINARIIEEQGPRVFKEWQENLEYFYREAAKIPGLKIMGMDAASFDYTKINLDFGINGLEVEQRLNSRGIFPELITGNILMCMTGIGNTRADYDALLTALREIGRELHNADDEIAESRHAQPSNNSVPGEQHLTEKQPIPEKQPMPGKQAMLGEQHLTEKQVPPEKQPIPGEQPIPEKQPMPGKIHEVPQQKETIKLADAAGRVCATAIIPYPPGAPLVCPGEEITQEIVDYVTFLKERGEKVMGIDAHGNINVGKERR